MSDLRDMSDRETTDDLKDMDERKSSEMKTSTSTENMDFVDMRKNKGKNVNNNGNNATNESDGMGDTNNKPDSGLSAKTIWIVVLAVLFVIVLIISFSQNNTTTKIPYDTGSGQVSGVGNDDTADGTIDSTIDGTIDSQIERPMRRTTQTRRRPDRQYILRKHASKWEKDTIPDLDDRNSSPGDRQRAVRWRDEETSKDLASIEYIPNRYGDLPDVAHLRPKYDPSTGQINKLANNTDGERFVDRETVIRPQPDHTMVPKRLEFE
jgi:hypothetical protein